MNIRDFQRRTRALLEEGITADEPHVSLRCQENGIAFARVKRMLLDRSARPLRLVEDRPGVFKAYYRLGRDRELKVVVDFPAHGKLNVRAVKVLGKRHQRALDRTNVLIMLEAGEADGEHRNHG